jgi:hypothetical protein
MVSKKLLSIVGSIFLMVASACNLPGGTAVVGGTNQDPTAAIETRATEIVASTAAAQTALANALASTLTAMATNTPEFTFTPSITPTPSISPTPSFTPTPRATLTPEFPMVSVSVETNCRSGPGSAYGALGILRVGQTAQVVGRYVYNTGTPGNDYWIIKLPSDPTVTCWVWGMYATVVGNTAGLPAINPPPTPTPAGSFTVNYTGTTTCAPDFFFRFNITNNGSITWQSIKITITDNTAPATFIHSLDSFRGYIGCVVDLDQSDLMPGEGGPVSNYNPGQLGYNPAGHSFTAVFRICSENGLAGTCLEKTLTFNP